MGIRPTSPTRPMSPDTPPSAERSSYKVGMLQRLSRRFFGRDEPATCFDEPEQLVWSDPEEQAAPKKRGCSNRPVGIGLPRQATFKRQNSERRERLCPVPPNQLDRRAQSTARIATTSLTRPRSNSTPAPNYLTRYSAPALGTTFANDEPIRQDLHAALIGASTDTPAADIVSTPEQVRPPRPSSVTSSHQSYERQRDPVDDRALLNAELDTKWILNLSMHFRDKSDREKFFVTYAESPNKWRRVTVSIDYRNAEQGSLEMDLKDLSFQRDKSFQIYEAIHESLPEIQFYDTVTNLKLETSDGRLHVHVTEDVNEIVSYPLRSSIGHILHDQNYRPMECRESELSFDAHLSGFVYRVKYKNKVYIKKEIPGPDTVDEFLYEVNALHALCDSEHVIRLEGIVFDDTRSVVKGLLISYAERGAVVDLLYDDRGNIPWEHRELWAKHAVVGLSEIHEEGYVQGDFTLSNIVVDAFNNARIIDINRRGCPVGWEPPELAKKIASNQRISMYIGEKSDLYQLGMSLWALAMDDDEPERHDPPLSTQNFPSDVPTWFQAIVQICLSPQPRDRLSAKTLLTMFPHRPSGVAFPGDTENTVIRSRPDKRYIDPAAAVERDDIARLGAWQDISDIPMYSPESSRGDPTFTYPRSSDYDHEYGSANSEIERPRGRQLSSSHEPLFRPIERIQDIVHSDVASPRVITRTPDDMDLDMEPVQYFQPRHHHAGFMHRTSPPNGTGHTSAIPTEYMLDHLASRHHSLIDEEFRGRSPPSEGTPRNSSIRITDTSVRSENVSGDRQAISEMNGDLACLGHNPHIQSKSIETPESSRTSAATSTTVTSSLPRLTFTDSGFNEPSLFGIDSDEQPESCTARTVDIDLPDLPSFDHAVPTPATSHHDEQAKMASPTMITDTSLPGDPPETIETSNELSEHEHPVVRDQTTGG